MTDTTPSMQATKEKETVEMAAPPKWAIDVMGLVGELKKSVADGFREVDTRLTTIEGNQTLQGGQVLDIGKRITAAEARIGEVEARQNTNSIRVRSESDVNLHQDKAIAEVLQQVNALANRPDTTDRVIAEVKAAAKTPLGQKLIGAAGGLLLIVIGFATVAMQVKMTELEKKPEAPTVYVQMPAPVPAVTDGGAP